MSNANDEHEKMPNLRFVLTGGPWAGKTTVLEALAARGYQYVPESARALIRQRLAAGLSPRPPLEQFGWDMLRMDITRYRDTPVTDAPVFFDRSVVDAVSMLAEHGALSEAEAAAHIRACRSCDCSGGWRSLFAPTGRSDTTAYRGVRRPLRFGRPEASPGSRPRSATPLC